MKIDELAISPPPALLVSEFATAISDDVASNHSLNVFAVVS
jgi:hypothetical protein